MNSEIVNILGHHYVRVLTLLQTSIIRYKTTTAMTPKIYDINLSHIPLFYEGGLSLILHILWLIDEFMTLKLSWRVQ